MKSKWVAFTYACRVRYFACEGCYFVDLVVKMCEFNNAVKIISVIYLLIVEASCHSDNYIEYSMEEPEICHFLGGKHKKQLLNMTAAIVKPSQPFNFWTRNTDTTCKYVIKSPKNMGLFAVIQNMYLRGNETSCTDWVQFKANGRRSKKFCDKIDDVDPRYVKVDSEEFFKPEFLSVKGDLQTEIFISKAEKLPNEEHRHLKIVYTPYQDCDKIDEKSDYPISENNVCIWKDYYCDGTRNCAFDKCRDEIGCKIMIDGGTGTKVTVGAVTTMLLLFLLFVICLWICRKYNKLCWSPDCAGPNLAENDNRRSIVLGTRDLGGGSVVPSAPMLDSTATRSLQDKDLPPSYDSLFPEQPIPTTTTATTATETETETTTTSTST